MRESKPLTRTELLWKGIAIAVLIAEGYIIKAPCASVFAGVGCLCLLICLCEFFAEKPAP